MNEQNNAPRIVDRLARSTYVVLLKVNDVLTLYMDPGLNKPWRGQGVFGKKFGDHIVKECKAAGYRAECRTWQEAFDLLVKQYGGPELVEKTLHDQLVAKQLKIANPTPPRTKLRE